MLSALDEAVAWARINTAKKIKHSLRNRANGNDLSRGAQKRGGNQDIHSCRVWCPEIIDYMDSPRENTNVGRYMPP